MSTLDKQFTATLQKSPNKGGWTYVVLPGSAELFGTRVRYSGASLGAQLASVVAGGMAPLIELWR